MNFDPLPDTIHKSTASWLQLWIWKVLEESIQKYVNEPGVGIDFLEGQRKDFIASQRKKDR